MFANIFYERNLPTKFSAILIFEKQKKIIKVYAN